MFSLFVNFHALQKEKQDRILNAALAEFAKQGYEKASTNEIVREAGISKGSLFRYFPTKKNLYLYLYDTMSDVMVKDFYSMKTTPEKDIFRIMRQASLIKLELYRKYPDLYKFLLSAHFEENREIREELDKRTAVLTEDSYVRLFGGMDTSRFRPDLDAKTAFQIILWSLEGLAKKIEAERDLKNIDEDGFKAVIDEMDDYLKVLEKLFYI